MQTRSVVLDVKRKSHLAERKHRKPFDQVATAPSCDLERDENRSPEDARPEVNGICFDNITMEAAIDQIRQALLTSSLTRIAFLNADCSNLANRNADYRHALSNADRVYADGVGIRIAGRILGFTVQDNVNGTDLFPRLCQELSGSDARVFLLGGQPGVPEKVKEWIDDKAPGLKVCGFHHGYFDPADEAEVLRQIDDSKANLVLVAFGAPKQDLWIRDVLGRSGARVGIGVGGLFDFYSGRIPRAPLWMRKLGIEWTFRLYQEPGRLWRRYIIGNATFLARTVFYRSKRRRLVKPISVKPGAEVRNA